MRARVGGVRLTKDGGLSVQELQQNVLEDGQSGGGERAGRHRALLVHHLRLPAPLRRRNVFVKCVDHERLQKGPVGDLVSQTKRHTNAAYSHQVPGNMMDRQVIR